MGSSWTLWQVSKVDSPRVEGSVVMDSIPIGRRLDQLWHVIGVVAPGYKCGSYPITHDCDVMGRRNRGRGVFDRTPYGGLVGSQARRQGQERSQWGLPVLSDRPGLKS